MRRNFKLDAIAARLRPSAEGKKDAFVGWKAALAALALANVAAYFLLVNPLGGSSSDLQQQLNSLRAGVLKQQMSLRQMKALVKKVEKAQSEQAGFLSAYFMDRRTTSSTILTEIGQSAQQTGLKPREHSFVIEPVEGSDSISMMTITANYEGSFSDLVEFVNKVDRSSRFLIIDHIQAAPQQTAGMLAVRFKMNTFVRESGARAQRAEVRQ